MAILPLRYIGDPILRQKAKKVPKIDDSIQRLIDDMFETMFAAPGVGLAAPQVGVGLRLVVIQVDEGEPITLINPEIVKKSGERRVTEGCLSIPGYAGEVTRAESVTVKGLDRHGKPIRLKGEGLLAQAFEHEIDHVDGVLYVDRVDSREDIWPVRPDGDDSEEEVEEA